MAILPSDPPANILEARPWLITLNEAFNIPLTLQELPNTYPLGDFQTTAVSAVIGDVSFVRFTGSTAGQTLTLPTAGGVKSRRLHIKNTSTQTVTIARAGSDTITVLSSTGTVASTTIVTGGQATLVSDGSSAWYVI